MLKIFSRLKMTEKLDEEDLRCMVNKFKSCIERDHGDINCSNREYFVERKQLSNNDRVEKSLTEASELHGLNEYQKLLQKEYGSPLNTSKKSSASHSKRYCHTSSTKVKPFNRKFVAPASEDVQRRKHSKANQEHEADTLKKFTRVAALESSQCIARPEQSKYTASGAVKWSAKEEASYQKVKNEFYKSTGTEANLLSAREDIRFESRKNMTEKSRIVSSSFSDTSSREEVNMEINLETPSKEDTIVDEYYNSKDILIETLKKRLEEKDEEIFDLTMRLEKCIEQIRVHQEQLEKCSELNSRISRLDSHFQDETLGN
eukprot:augustus_masked-scaffold_89-processed-gene-0.7-mRNA-1 protein AED:1.00 eAED:1.00 QI:0/-1/0/0/-1/1/1/0/316